VLPTKDSYEAHVSTALRGQLLPLATGSCATTYFKYIDMLPSE
jgi:hypothetical protein